MHILQPLMENPHPHAKSLTVMRWEGREGKEAISSRILAQGHGQPRNVSRLRPRSPLAPITSSEKAHFPSFYLILLFPSLKASVWKCIRLHFCSIMYHLAPLLDCKPLTERCLSNHHILGSQNNVWHIIDVQ